MARVLVLTGDAAEELDSMYPVFRLREGGHEAIVSAPTTRAVKLVVHDFEPGWDAYTERPGHQLPVDLAFADVRPEDFQALVIPGGRAPEYIRIDPDVARIVRTSSSAACRWARFATARRCRPRLACCAAVPRRRSRR